MKAILFDMDGVLNDSEYFFYSTMSKMIKECYGVDKEVNDDLISSMTGQTDAVVYAKMVEFFGVDVSEEQFNKETNDYYDRHYGGFANAASPMEGSLDFVKKCKEKGFKVAVVTSSNMEYTLNNMRNLKMEGLFDLIQTGDDIIHSKPDPEIYLLASNKLGLEAKDCVVIEDSKNGVMAGKNATMFTIGFKQSKIKQDTSLADLEVYNFKEIDLDCLKEK